MEAEYEILSVLRKIGRRILGKEVPMTKDEVICKLTANEKCAFTSEQLKEWELADLETLLSMLEAKEPEPEPEEEDEPKGEVTPLEEEPAGGEPKLDDEPSELEKALAKALAPISTRLDQMDDQMKVIASHQKRTDDEAKAEYVEALAANKACVFSEKELQAMELDVLDKLARSLIPTDFTGRPFPRVHDSDEVPDMPAIEFTKEGCGWKGNGK